MLIIDIFDTAVDSIKYGGRGG